MASLGSIVLSLSADTATFEGDMGRAAQIAERNSQRMVRSTKETSNILRELGQGASIINFSGFDGLVKGSGVAKEALHGLAGAIGLIGIASWPVAVAVAAGAALTYFAGEAAKSTEEVKKLDEAHQQLIESLNKDASLKFRTDLSAQINVLDTLRQSLIDAQIQLNALKKAQDNAAGLTGKAGEDIKAAAAAAYGSQLQVVSNLQTQISDRTIKVKESEEALRQERKAAYQEAISPLITLRDQLQEQILAYGKTGEAALEFRLTSGDLAKSLKAMGVDAAGTKAQLLELQGVLDSLNNKPELITPIDMHPQKLKQVTAEASTEAEEYAKQARSNIQDILGTGLYDALKGNFDDILSSFADMILQMIAQAYAARIALSLTGSGSAFGNFLAGISGGAKTGRAMGGNVLAGVPTTVNEMSRSGFPGETFIPNVPGVVVPAGGAGGGFTFNMPVDARGADAGAAARLLQAVPVIEKRIQAKVEFFASRGRWPGG